MDAAALWNELQSLPLGLLLLGALVFYELVKIGLNAREKKKLA